MEKLEFEEIKDVKVFDRLGTTLNQPHPFIFIGWRGFGSQESHFTDLNPNISLTLLRLGHNMSDRP